MRTQIIIKSLYGLCFQRCVVRFFFSVTISAAIAPLNVINVHLRSHKRVQIECYFMYVRFESLC